MLRESAELASLAAAARAGVPTVHVCIGMHEVASHFAAVIGDPLEELGRLAGLDEGRLTTALAGERAIAELPPLAEAVAALVDLVG